MFEAQFSEERRKKRIQHAEKIVTRVSDINKCLGKIINKQAK